MPERLEALQKKSLGRAAYIGLHPKLDIPQLRRGKHMYVGPSYAHKLLNKGSDNSTSTEAHTTLRSSPGFAWEITASIDARWKTANAVVNLYCGACKMFSESEKRGKCARDNLPSVEGAHGTMQAIIYHLIPSNVSKRGAPAFHTVTKYNTIVDNWISDLVAQPTLGRQIEGYGWNVGEQSRTLYASRITSVAPAIIGSQTGRNNSAGAGNGLRKIC
ncbi:hypothetical protein B0H11DRAFT_1922940 [Mycena galericulata]|nr:hypothetical protein B0H11DRAFT_1922940 [Mycena galericulata]